MIPILLATALMVQFLPDFGHRMTLWRLRAAQGALR
jgi:hypothetical protein